MRKSSSIVEAEEKKHKDPITGARGAHPLGTGAGAASGALAGALTGGMVGGPAGALVAGAIGAIAGGLVGKTAAEELNPTTEEEFWRKAFVEEPYYLKGTEYNFYAPAYKLGWEARAHYEGQRFEDIEAELREQYDKFVSEGRADWPLARQAARSAWDRVDTIRTRVVV